MLQKKICMLGGFAVGKTSLVSRFVHSLFSDKYHSTVGVKIDKKPLTVDGQPMNLMLWDVNGQDDFQAVQASHLRGMSGYLLVVDGTRRATLDTAKQVHDKAIATVGQVPFLTLLNKSDLGPDWEIDEKELMKLVEQGWRIVRTSAKTGDGVEAALETLARAMLARPADERRGEP